MILCHGASDAKSSQAFASVLLLNWRLRFGRIGLIEKPAGTKPAAGSDELRHYERHWTPVHIDFHVDDFEAFLARAVNAGAKCEQKFEGRGRPAIAFCSDPFGNGFCVLGTTA